MTKQEYENKRAELLQNCETENDYYVDSDKLREQYIESLEAENATLSLLNSQSADLMLKLQERIHELEADNATLQKALEKAIEIFADEGAIFCPAIRVGYICNDGKGCDKLDSCETDICWREYLMSGGGRC